MPPQVNLPKIIIEWAKANPVVAATILGATAPTTAAIGTNAIQSVNAANPNNMNMEPLRGTQTESKLKTMKPVDIAKQAQGMRQSAQIAPPPVPPLPQQTTTQPQQPNQFWNWFKQYGVPLATAGVGLGVPGALPGATGFAQGYVGERQRQQQGKEASDAANAKIDVAILDEESGKLLDQSGKPLSPDQITKNTKFMTRNRASGFTGMPAMPGGSQPPLPGTTTPTAAQAAKTLISEDMVNQYMQQYPDKSREEIIAAMQRQ